MTNNNIYFIANWKMYGNTKDIEKTKPIIRLSKSKKYKKVKIVYCPPYTLLNDFYVKTKLEQNEVLYKMLKTEELAIFLIFSF